MRVIKKIRYGRAIPGNAISELFAGRVVGVEYIHEVFGSMGGFNGGAVFGQAWKIVKGQDGKYTSVPAHEVHPEYLCSCGADTVKSPHALYCDKNPEFDVVREEHINAPTIRSE